MGVHICVQDKDGKDHPAWNFIRHAGDKEFCMLGLPRGAENDEGGFRPDAFEPWYEAAKALD